MVERTRTIKVSEEEYQQIISARAELAKMGYNTLPVKPEENTDFAMGAIVGLGMALLIHELARKDRR